MKKKIKSKNIVIENQKPYPIIFLNSILISYSVTIILFILYSIMITYTRLTIENSPIFITLITIISVFIGGYDTSQGVKNRKFFWGLIFGLIYAIILQLVEIFILKNFSLDLNKLNTFILSISSGGVGAILGVYIKKK